MSDRDPIEVPAAREYAQLMRLHERLLRQLERVLGEATSPGSVAVISEVKARTGMDIPMSDVARSVEEAIRELKLAQAQVRKALRTEHPDLEVEGVPNLPAVLQRFLAERASMEGFTYQVTQDEVRGWVIAWKEYTPRGTVRGYGQFYERPYAWLEK